MLFTNSEIKKLIQPTHKPKCIMGLRNIVTDTKRWKYLLFYEVDNPTETQIKDIINFLDIQRLAYLMYSTKGGLHVIGLTPMSITNHAIIFSSLQDRVPEYFSGETIRLSRKEGEKQEYIYCNLDYPIIPNLFEIYSKRFFQNKSKEFFELFQQNLITDTQWHLVFEKYWSFKK